MNLSHSVPYRVLLHNLSPPQPVLEWKLWELVQGGLLMGHMSFLPTNISVTALKETQSNNPNQCPGLILSSSTARLLMQTVLLYLSQFSDDSTTIMTHSHTLQNRQIVYSSARLKTI